MKKLMNKKGFTLVEMLIVVAIIAILAVIAIPSMTDSLDNANEATDTANLRTAKSAYASQIAAEPDLAKPNTDAKKTLLNQVFNIESGEFEVPADGQELTKGECDRHAGLSIGVDGTTGEVCWGTYASKAFTAAADAYQECGDAITE